MKRSIRRALVEALGPEYETCPKCLGPHRGTWELPTVVVHEGDPIPHCEECGELTYQDGRTAVAMGPSGPYGAIVMLCNPPDPEHRE